MVGLDDESDELSHECFIELQKLVERLSCGHVDYLEKEVERVELVFLAFVREELHALAGQLLPKEVITDSLGDGHQVAAQMEHRINDVAILPRFQNMF